MTRQFFPPLTDDEEERLRGSIERSGRVLVPIVLDRDGEIIDGHNRKRIADELGVPCPVMQIDASGADAVVAAFDLNLARRHLSREQMSEYAVQRHADGASTRTIASELGVSKSSVARDLANTPSGVPDGTPAREAREEIARPARTGRAAKRTKWVTPPAPRVEGRDGKTYPAAKPAPTPEEQVEAERRAFDALRVRKYRAVMEGADQFLGATFHLEGGAFVEGLVAFEADRADVDEKLQSVIRAAMDLREALHPKAV